MNLIRTSLLNSIAVAVKMLTLLGINKLLAVYVGPIGYASLGQLQNAMTMITTFASGAINMGVTKYTAEYYDDEAEQQAVWRTAGTIALIGSIFTSLLIALFSRSLASWFLKDENLASVFLWFAGTLVFFVFNALFLAILNGKKEIGRYVSANIAGSLFAFLITSLLAGQYGLYGALVALAIFQSVAFVVTLILCYKASWFKFSYFIGSFDIKIAKNLVKYTLMALSSAICVPISQIVIRNYLGKSLGWEAAGYWEAMWRLSTAYLLLVTTVLSVYFLPKIAELSDPNELKNEINQGYKIILPIVIICSLLIYLFRDLIIGLLFTAEFYPIRQLFLGQVIGDILKIGSWILAFIMLGKAMANYFIFTEISFSLSFYFIVVLMTNIYGLEGVSWAYALNYLLYWIVMYFLIFRKLGQKN
jgi:polysaccharide transporter, PST family